MHESPQPGVGQGLSANEHPRDETRNAGNYRAHPRAGQAVRHHGGSVSTHEVFGVQGRFW